MFNKRDDNSISKHSGYIGIDIDELVNPEEIKEKLRYDKYVVAIFTSVSGRGLCVVFHINGGKHREAFQGLSQYLYESYGIVVDPTSINVSRARFVSYDPHIFISANYDKFLIYPKEKPPKKIEKVVFDKDDFGNILKEIVSRRLNLCENYHDWLRIGFAISHRFGEVGREYFHIVSQYSSKYQSNATDRQYSACIKHHGRNEATIATFYYYCKNAGVPLYSERTKKIVHTASSGKKGGLTMQKVAENLKTFENIDDAEDLIKQVFENDIAIHEDGLIPELELWLRQNYDFKRNAITLYIENGNSVLKNKDFNSVWIAGKKIFPELSFELLDRLINSDFVPTYNPFLDFIEEHKDRKPEGLIDKFWGCIKTKDTDYVKYFGKKWLVGIIASIHGDHTPLMPVLSGAKQNTGKTQFFRRFLPVALKKFFAESKLDAGKDDAILMTQKLVICDDEMGGKSKKENKLLKELTSKEVFSLREPYGRNNVDLVRLAALCGTSNDNELLNDPTGNRRIIPMHVYSIDFDVYNAIDKIELFMEAYHLWKTGYAYQLTDKEIEYLGQDKVSFEVTCMEKELIQKYFEVGEEEHMSASEIKIYLDNKTNQKLILDKVGKELKSLGFKQIKVDSGNRRVYCVQKKVWGDRPTGGPPPGETPF
jgi:hypothetical protein